MIITERRMAKNGKSYREIAGIFNLGLSTVGHIISGRSWDWLK